MDSTIYGYKVFNPDWKCRDFQYELGKVYVENEPLEICEVGFHFCKKLEDCFTYYAFRPDNKVATVMALGDIIEKGDKCCTNKILIVKELSWYEVLDIVNDGKANTGIGNVGQYNTGSSNNGRGNAGSNNIGNGNTGFRNKGDLNSGNYNIGFSNSGNYNIGRNNSGYFNRTDYATGCFCVEPQTIKLFDKDSELTMAKWLSSTACHLIASMFCNYMIDEYETEEEMIEQRQKWWDSLSGYHKSHILDIPNFDASKFKEITGISVKNCKSIL